MDQLTAYKILGLEPGSSPEEIKEAYATLSKQYHPEEEPEKFQEIHEAYVTLTRRKRRGSVEHVYQEEWREPKEEQPKFHFETPREEEPQEETKQEELDFGRVGSQQKSPIEQGYDFDNALIKAQQQTEEKLHELVLEAGAELKVLASPKYSSNLKAYRAFFEDKKYEQIFRRAEFLEKMCVVLEETKLKKNVYDYIIDFYRLRGMQPSDLSPIGLRLYQVLDEKAGIKKKVNPGVFGGAIAGLVAGLQSLRPLIRQSEILTGIVLGVIAVLLLVWAFKRLKEKRSALLTQIVISIVLAVSQFIVIAFDGYGTLFGSVDDGNIVAGVLFMLACAWFVVVLVVAVIKAIVGLIMKK